MFKDFEGRGIPIGGFIVYAVRRGSSLTLTRGQVTHIGYKARWAGGPVDVPFVRVRPQRRDAHSSCKPVDLTNFLTIVVTA